MAGRKKVANEREKKNKGKGENQRERAVSLARHAPFSRRTPPNDTEMSSPILKAKGEIYQCPNLGAYQHHSKGHCEEWPFPGSP